jgi:hypothetical protein
MPDERLNVGYGPGTEEPFLDADRCTGMRAALWVLTTILAAAFVVAMIPLRPWLEGADRSAYP